MENLIKIDIPYKSHLANLVKGYATTFKSVTNFRCESISNDNKQELELEINFGTNYLDYTFENSNHLIIINYEEIGDSVGTYFTAEKLEKLTVMIEHDETNFDVKKNAYLNF